MWMTGFYLYVIQLLLYIFIKKNAFSSKRAYWNKKEFTTIEIGGKSSSFTELLCDVEVGEKMIM